MLDITSSDEPTLPTFQTFSSDVKLPWREANEEDLAKFSILRRKGSSASYVSKADQVPANPTVPEGQAFLFKSPVHLLATVMPNITPYPWQRQELLRIAGYRDGLLSSTPLEYQAISPYRSTIVAANGSGKDFILLAAAAVWLAMRYVKTRIVITSSSWTQLDRQTEPHILNLIQEINRKLGAVFRSVRFKHHCPVTGSVIDLVLSDDPGMIEGYHPWPGGKLALFLNECKSISDSIYEAWQRCTEYSWWLNVSSSGAKEGFFYRAVVDSETIQHPKPLESPAQFTRTITAYDCPHIPRFHIEECRRRMPDWWVKSSLLGEFFSLDSDFVVTEDMLLDLDGNVPKIVGDTFGIGLDISAGGDESTLFIRKGNALLDMYCFRQSNTVIEACMIDEFLNRYVPPRVEYKFFADDGGIGHAVIDMLIMKGWHITRIHNQSTAEESTLYANLGAEQYFHVKKLIQQHLITPPKDAKLRQQLCSRRYDQVRSGKCRLEPKPEHRQRTKESPDRADGYVLCFASLPLSIGTLVRRAETPVVFESVDKLIFDYKWRQGFGHPSPPSNNLPFSLSV